MRVYREEQGRTLFLDMECLPGHWIGGDYVSRIPTAYGYAWGDDPDNVVAHTHYEKGFRKLIDKDFSAAVEDADMVVGHFIRGFDLRLLNGERLRLNLSSLGEVLAMDTKLDLKTVSGRSQSQKNLAALLGCESEKLDVTLTDWELFNLREPGYDGVGEERVIADVLQNMEMYDRLIELGWLNSPQTWSPNRSSSPRYHA